MLLSVRERLIVLEKELTLVKKELTEIKEKGGGVFPEWADLRTTARLFATYSVATLRHRIKAGIIPKTMVRKEGKKYIINTRLYKESFM